MRVALSLSLLLLILATSARAQGDPVSEAAAVLERQSVYESPENDALDAGDARRISREIDRSGLSLDFAELPASAGNSVDVLEALNRGLGGRGIVAVLVGDRLLAGANRDVGFTVSDLADQAAEENRGDPADGIVQFVQAADRRAEEPGGAVGPGSSRDRPGDGPSAAPLLILLGLAGGGALLLSASRRRRRRREEQEQLAEVKQAAEEDLVALGEDIRALDLDVEMPSADPRAKEDYGRAVAGYDAANQRLARAQSLEDLRGLGEQLEEARFAMTAAKAGLAGQPVPERRPPCFFDPRHGPSVGEVEWAPPGGAPRPVPACAADTIAVQEGREPAAREVEAGGVMRPWWQAPTPFAGYYGGYFSPFGGFGGGFLGGLLVGDLLGHGFGGFGGFGGVPMGYDPDPGGDAGFGDFGGGDFGGGFGGDFGGGDFGGGDF